VVRAERPRPARGDVDRASAALEQATGDHGWDVRRIRFTARAFADVHALAARRGTDRHLKLAAAVDAGFGRVVFADMIDSLTGFTGEEIDPDAQLPAIRLRRRLATGLATQDATR
jgi:hypothetical protein